MDAVILAGGKGVGLEPITHTRPKVLVPILGRKLIEYHLCSLIKYGIKRVIIVINYMGELIKEHLNKSLCDLGVDVVFVNQGAPLGTAHALAKAMPFVRTDEFLLVYGDVFYVSDITLGQLIEGKGNMITVSIVDDPGRYGVVVADGERVVKIVEKPKEFISNYVNAGIYRFRRDDIVRFLEKVEVSDRGEYELTSALQSMIDSGYRLSYLVIRKWMDIGRPWSLLEANKLLLNELNIRDIKGDVEGNVVIKGPVIVDDGARILSGSYIVGPVYIGKDVEVGPNAYVRPYSVILDGSRIGFNVEVKESVIMEHTHISHQAYVGDSIVCEGVNLGAGTILANLRFDGKTVKVRVKGAIEDSGRRKLGAFIGGYVRTGVNVSVFPGVKIGAYSWIYPGVVVTDDVPPKSILKYGGVIVDKID